MFSKGIDETDHGPLDFGVTPIAATSDFTEAAKAEWMDIRPASSTVRHNFIAQGVMLTLTTPTVAGRETDGE
jgi:hypothetical protein